MHGDKRILMDKQDKFVYTSCFKRLVDLGLVGLLASVKDISFQKDLEDPLLLLFYFRLVLE